MLFSFLSAVKDGGFSLTEKRKGEWMDARWGSGGGVGRSLVAGEPPSCLHGLSGPFWGWPVPAGCRSLLVCPSLLMALRIMCK